MSNTVTNLVKTASMSPAQKAVLMCLADRADDDGIAWPSVARICEWTCLGRTAVSAAVKWLEGAGWIDVERCKNGRTNHVRINLALARNLLVERSGSRGAPARQAIGTCTDAGEVPARAAVGSQPVGGLNTSIPQQHNNNAESLLVPLVPHAPESLADERRWWRRGGHDRAHFKRLGA